MAEKETKPIHSGHRERVKQKFYESELDTFADHEILEFLLFYSIPRHNTNPLGHDLMERYKNLSRVFDAEFDDLLTINGINKNSATLIKLIPALCRKYMIAKQNIKLPRLSSLNAILEYVPAFFIGKTVEELHIICMDKTCKVLCQEILSKGSLESTPVDLKSIANVVVKANASRVILAHNHPSGMAVPSIADIETTRKIKQLLNSMNVELDDHIIVTAEKTISMNTMGMVNYTSVNK